MSTAHGRADAFGRIDFSTNILASMNLALVSDSPTHERGVLHEDARGWVGHCELPPCGMRTKLPLPAAPREADVSIWLIERGRLTIEQHNGIEAGFGAGTLLLCDGAHPLRGRWERARFGHVRPSGAWLMQVLGHAPQARTRPVETLGHQALAPFLGSQLQMLVNLGAALKPADLETVLDSIFQTTEALLKMVFASDAPHGAAPAVDRLQAVHRYIQRNLHRPELRVEDIARGTSISRAQLYRLFESLDKSVHATLREERLVKSMGYLAQPESDRLSIGAIAYACGFSDQAVFSKLFRQRFDMTPREARSAGRPLP